MNRLAPVSLLAASLIIAGAATVAAQQTRYVETGKEFQESGRVTMGGELLTDQEKQQFMERRKAAKNRAELDQIEAEESALLNERVNQRIGQALQQPVSPSTAEQPTR